VEIVSPTVRLAAVEIREKVPSVPLVTQALEPFGLMAMPTGPLPTGTVAVTVWVAVSIRETEPLPPPLLLTAHVLRPSGLTAMPMGRDPTAMVAHR